MTVIHSAPAGSSIDDQTIAVAARAGAAQAPRGRRPAFADGSVVETILAMASMPREEILGVSRLRVRVV